MVRLLFAFVFFCFLQTTAQRQHYNWCFGTNAGLDFNTIPPTTYSSAINPNNTSSTISDGQGNLLFYSRGDTLFNRQHVVMANGAGLFGFNCSSTSLIVRKPQSNNLYYVFTLDGQGGGSSGKGLSYSIVDMNLAAGMGSVTTKNVQLFLTTQQTTGGNLTAAMHCNRTDVWIITKETQKSPKDVLAFLLTSTGVNNTPVVSKLPYNIVHTSSGDCNISVAPAGNRLAISFSKVLGQFTRYVAIASFDNQSGKLDSAIIELNADPSIGVQWLEFSPDGSKLYGLAQQSISNFYQWDLCSGNQSSINSSRQDFTVPITNTISTSQPFGTMEISPDGHIQIGRQGQFANVVINYPNSAGISCSISPLGQPLTNTGSLIGSLNGEWLPNIPNDDFRNFGSAFIPSTKCRAVDFMAPAHMQSSCAATQPTYSSIKWNFGDPLSGTTNTSTLLNPSHTYPSVGNYTVRLVVNYACFSDTFMQEVHILQSGPVFTITGNQSICPGQTSVLHASGNYTFHWSGNHSGATVSLTPAQTISYYVVATDSLNCSTGQYVQVTVNNCIGIDEIHKSTDLLIFPNPTNDVVTLFSERSANAILYDQLGNQLLDKKCSHGNTAISLKSYPAGVYFLVVYRSDSVLSSKVVKIE